MELKRPAPRGPAHMSAIHRRIVFATFAALVASAAAWLALHYFFVVEGPFGPERNPLETWSLRAHGAAAMAALLVVGSLLPGHVKLGWLRQRNLATAIPLAALVAFLVATGYGLYYAGDEEMRVWLSVSHWVAGFASGVGLLAHAVPVRRTRKRSREATVVVEPASGRP